MKRNKILPVGREVKIIADNSNHLLTIGETYKIQEHTSWGSYVIINEEGEEMAVAVKDTIPVPKRSFWTVLKNLIEQTPTAI